MSQQLPYRSGKPPPGPPQPYHSSRGRLEPSDPNIRSLEDKLTKQDRVGGDDGSEYLPTAQEKAKVVGGSTHSRMLNYPTRAGYATAGNDVVLYTNHFGMSFKDDVTIHRYSVTVTFDKTVKPEKSAKQKRPAPAATTAASNTAPRDAPVGKKLRRIVQLFINDGALQAQRSHIASNFTTLVLSSEPLPDTSLSGVVAYHHEDQAGPADTHDVYQVSLSAVPGLPLSLAVLRQYLSNAVSRYGSASYEGFREALNIILAHHPKSRPDNRTLSIGQQHYDTAHQNFDLRQGLLALRGFMTSARFSAGHLLAQVQIKHAAVYKPINLYDLCTQYNGWLDLYAVDKYIRGLRVKAKYLPPQTINGNIVYTTRTVLGLAMKSDVPKLKLKPGESVPNDWHPIKVPEDGSTSAQVEFWNEKKRGGAGYVSVYDFFLTNYPNPAQLMKPQESDENGDVSMLVKYGSRVNPKYMPIELCEIIPWQPCRKPLTGGPTGQTTKMLNIAARKPFENAASIETSANGVFGWSSPGGMHGNFGLTIDKFLLTVPGKILPAPSVRYGPDRTVTKTPFGGSWNMDKTKVNVPTRLPPIVAPNGKKSPAWMAVCVNGADMKSVKVALPKFQAELARMGVDLNPPSPPAPLTAVDRIDGLRKDSGHSKELIARAMNMVKKAGTRLVLFVLPNKDVAIYNMIKQVGDSEVGLHTICVQHEHFTSPKHYFAVQYWANVGLKFNLKLGGGNQGILDLDMGILREEKTMLMGLDVTHPSPGSSSKSPSVSAMVSSTDRFCYQFPAVLRRNPSRIEMVSRDKLEEMVTICLKRWKGQKLPENIIVYRDGVSEGQYNSVIQFEYTAIRDACSKHYKGKQTAPNISIIVCGKRHHTRFYPASPELAKTTDGRTSNPVPGTMVDRTVTSPRDWDFYLQAHKALKGTAKPCHYVVIHDEIFKQHPSMKDDVTNKLIKLTHNLCYLYGRATMAICLCPPAYYADRAAERARKLLANWFDGDDDSSTTGSQASLTPAQIQAQEQAIIDAQETALKIHDHLEASMFYI